jgi:hypothetical protein
MLSSQTTLHTDVCLLLLLLLGCACRASTLVHLKSQCDPKPESYDPAKKVPPLLDQCVNIASYWYKDNAQFYNLTR